MMIALVERMQSSAPGDHDAFGAWRNALRELHACFDRREIPSGAFRAELTGRLPDDQRLEAMEDLAAVIVWRSWQSRSGLTANEAWQAVNPGSGSEVPPSLIEEEFLARHQAPHGDGPALEAFCQSFPAATGLPAALAAHTRGGGRYVCLSLCGMGATSEVWEASDRKTGQSVALKQLLPRAAALPEFKWRLEHEFRAAARLEHPGIIPVLDYHAEAGVPWFTMPLMHGRTLAERITAQHQPPPDLTRRDLDAGLLALVQSLALVCEAVAFAHSQGVQHRDLKPANVLVTDEGAARILDWGFASGCASDTGAIAGTLEYMAPEQAAGRPEPASDVFGLGGILFTILTGETPCSPASHSATGHTAGAERIPSPSQLNPAAPPALVRLCLRALSGEPAARPAPLEMAGTLRQWVAAQRAPGWRRTLRRMFHEA